MILSSHSNARTNMTDNNPLPDSDSPDSDFTNFSGYLNFHDFLEEEDPYAFFSGQTPHQDQDYQTNQVTDFGGSGSRSFISTDFSSGHETREFKERVAFKTKSDVEILDDGYKWRKYGKKMVKNSPNPRNYYRCSVDGCVVKKRVERDREDSRYVITTYEGVHTHPSS